MTPLTPEQEAIAGDAVYALKPGSEYVVISDAIARAVEPLGGGLYGKMCLERGVLQERVKELERQLQAQSEDTARMRETLEGIANADIKTWDKGFDNPAEFMRWAQSRARSAIARKKALK